MRLKLKFSMRILATLSAVATLFILLSAAGCAVTGDSRILSPTGGSPGIRVERVTPALSGLMLDMRYRVVDSGAAQKLLSRKASLHLVDQASGLKLSVPNMAKVGKLRQLPAADNSDRIYWMFFGNPGGQVKRGDMVTLVVDGRNVQDIKVD